MYCSKLLDTMNNCPGRLKLACGLHASEGTDSQMAIGKLFHIIHMTGDLPELEAWYDDVFSVQRGFLDHHYMEGEKRDASLVVLGDCVIEPLAPAFRVEGWDAMPLGRFYNRFGTHWHSIAW